MNYRKCDYGRRDGIKPVRPATNSSFDTSSGANWCHTHHFFMVVLVEVF